MGLTAINDILTAVESALAPESGTSQWIAQREGWHLLEFNATNAGTLQTSLFVHDSKGKYAYQIIPECYGIAGALSNPLSDTQDTFANFNLGGGVVSLNESSEVKVVFRHYLFLEAGARISVNSALAATLNFVGVQRPVSTFVLTSVA